MYTIRILYLPLFIFMILLSILVIIGISVYSSNSGKCEINSFNNQNNKRLLEICNCCCCQCSNCNSGQNNGNNSGNNNPDDNTGDNNSGSNNSGNNNSGNNNSGNNNSGNNNSGNNNSGNNNKSYNILKQHEKDISISIFILTLFFHLFMLCFLCKYALLFELGCYFYVQLIITLAPLLISFILNLCLFIIRIKFQNAYIISIGVDGCIKLNRFLIFLNLFQLFLIIFIILLIILIFFVSIEKICEFIDFIICWKHCNCENIKLFLLSICDKQENEKKNDNTSSLNDISISIKNKEKNPKGKESPIDIEKEINSNSKDDDDISKINFKIKNLEKPPQEESNIINKEIIGITNPIAKKNINPEGQDCEMYISKSLLGQKILIVMVYYEDTCNIDKLYKNGDNKTVKDAVSHFGIDIVSVNNYNDAIKELTKDENGKCPYYACWVINNYQIEDKGKLFLKLLYAFWRNGGAVVLFADNEPYIEETNLFLKMINAGFTMNGDYIGKKDIYGDNSGLLNSPALFNRKKEIYKYKEIQRQALSHNLYTIYEGNTISSITKNNKRGMDVKLSDISPFIAFARDSEGGITSLMKLANDDFGDLIIDGGFTKLFINMKETGTFRYVQNIAGFTARPEVHISNLINPKIYRPKKVTLDDIKNLESIEGLNMKACL